MAQYFSAFGALLLNSLTLALSLAVDTALFGRSFLTALGRLMSTVGGFFGLSFASWQAGLIFLFALKAAFSILVALAAWHFDFSGPLARLGRKANWLRARPSARASSWRSSVLGAFRDLTRPAFLLGFLLSILIVWFFARLRSDELVFLALRGGSIAFLGFAFLRRIDVSAVQKTLEKRFSPDMAVALAQAVRMLETQPGTQSRTALPDIPAGVSANSRENAANPKTVS
jgi:hypothetical protein